MWPISQLISRAQTVNMAIDIFTHARLTLRQDLQIKVSSKNLDRSWHFLNGLSGALDCQESEFGFYRQILIGLKELGAFSTLSGFELETFSESPVGAGLGGSSSLMISILLAFAKVTCLGNLSDHDLVNFAHNLEARVLWTPTGVQDYWPALKGGVLQLRFESSGTDVTVLTEEFPNLLQQLQNRMAVIYTGRSHHSGLSNWQTYKAVIEKDAKVIESLSQIADVADQLVPILRSQDWLNLQSLLQKEMEMRLQLSTAVSSPEIEAIQKLSHLNGGVTKICGAGGGGCVLSFFKDGIPESFKASIGEVESYKWMPLRFTSALPFVQVES